MTDAQLTILLAVLAAISVAVIIVTARNILREMNGLGDEDESQAERRKDAETRKEIERWREGR